MLFNIVRLKSALLSPPGGECRGNGGPSLSGCISSSSLWGVASPPNAPAFSAFSAPQKHHRNPELHLMIAALRGPSTTTAAIRYAALLFTPQQQPTLLRRAKGNGERLLPAPTIQALSRRVVRSTNASTIFTSSAISVKNIRPTTAARHHYRHSSTKGAYTTLLGSSAPAEPRAARNERSPTLVSPPSSGCEQTNTLANPLATHQSQRDAQPPPPTCRGEA